MKTPILRILFCFFALLALAAGPATGQIFPEGAGQSEVRATGEADAPSLDELIRILENEETRNRLLESLKAAAYQAPVAQDGEAASGTAGKEAPRTFAGQIAEWTQALAAGAAETWSDVLASLSQARSLAGGVSSIDIPAVVELILPVGLVAVIVFAILAATRLVRAPIFNRMADAAQHSGPINKLFIIVLSSVVDAVAVLIAWGLGVLAATIFFGGRPSFNQTLFLNAFLAIEMVKVVLAGFMAPNYPRLRLTPFSDRQASYWYFWFSRFISILGYTFMFAAPIVQRASGAQAAEALRFAVVTASLILAIVLIIKNRGTVRERLKRAKMRGDKSGRAYAYAFLGQIWWLLASAFVLSLFFVYVRSPEEGLAFMIVATLKSIAAMAVGGFVVSVLSRAIVRGIPIPQSWGDRLPLLERRINSFIPNALTVIRLLVLLIVFLLILEAWSLLSFSRWLEGAAGRQIAGGLIGAGIILTIGVAIYIAVSSWIEYRLNPNYGTVPTARERTLLSLFRNAFTITMVVVVTMLVLSQIGIDIAPLLAGAGVVGLAIGFGAQKFVQDIITGAFIQIQNAMNEGDIVELNGVSGTVEQLTVRSVGLRTLEGTWYLIPFSSVDQVANYSKDFAYYVADIGVAYREDVKEVRQMMLDAFAELKGTEAGENLLGDFEIWGVEQLGDSAVVVRGRVMTKPSTQWGIGRAYREIVKRLADERGIEIPYPHMTLYFGEDRSGSAPPVRVVSASSKGTAASADPTSVPSSSDAAGRITSESVGAKDSDGRAIPPGSADIDSSGDGRG